MLKQLSELRRTKEKKALQMKELIDKAEEYIRSNPPQPVVLCLFFLLTNRSSAYLDTEEVENKFDKLCFPEKVSFLEPMQVMQIFNIMSY